jgi:hypothetical protein
MLTRLGEAGADAFTIMRIAGHSSVTVSQRYVHPTPESLERAFEQLESLNAAKFRRVEDRAEAKAANAGNYPQKSPQAQMDKKCNLVQVIDFKVTGP